MAINEGWNRKALAAACGAKRLAARRAAKAGWRQLSWLISVFGVASSVICRHLRNKCSSWRQCIVAAGWRQLFWLCNENRY